MSVINALGKGSPAKVIYFNDENEDISFRLLREELWKCEEKHITDWATLKLVIREQLGDYIYKKTKRQPMLIPIIMEI